MRSLLTVVCSIVFTTSLLLPGASLASDTAYISVEASTGIDTLVKGVEGSIIVSLDVGADTAFVVQLSFEWQFTNGNIIGPLAPPENPKYASQTIAVFESIFYSPGVGSGTDTTFSSLVDFGSTPVWSGGGEILRFISVPLDTGTIVIDPEIIGRTPEDFTLVQPSGISEFIISATAPPITVVTCASIVITGDVNRDGTITSSDIIYMVGHVFKGGPAPLPVSVSGDVNCTGDNTSSDIIFLVNFIFKSGPPPCDVCSII